jgi:hypothetical protein
MEGGGQKTLHRGRLLAVETRANQHTMEHVLTHRTIYIEPCAITTHNISQMLNVEERVHNGSVHALAHMNKVTRWQKSLCLPRSLPARSHQRGIFCTFMARCRSDGIANQ